MAPLAIGDSVIAVAKATKTPRVRRRKCIICVLPPNRVEILPLGKTPQTKRSPALAGLPFDGETRARTGDTTIFSRVLYQLSYLAGMLWRCYRLDGKAGHNGNPM